MAKDAGRESFILWDSFKSIVYISACQDSINDLCGIFQKKWSYQNGTTKHNHFPMFIESQ